MTTKDTPPGDGKKKAPIDEGKKTGGKKKSKSSPKREIMVRGTPRKFTTEEDYQQAFISYVEHCERRKDMPNIAGFCVFCDMHRETYYNQANIYPETHQKIKLAIEDRAVNQKVISPAMGIFYLKNAFNYSDSGGGGDSLHIDVDFDADSDEIDTLMSKLGYQPLLTD